MFKELFGLPADDTGDESRTDFAALRARMVERQLAARGIRDPRVLRAMLAVPRELFVPESERAMSYQDGALPIGFDQTISQPYTVAFMAEAAQLKKDDHVLEVGTGCGYGAAVLGQLAHRVDTIERIPELADIARMKLVCAGCDNVFVHVGDGTIGLPDGGPFDAIVVTAGGFGLPDAYAEQLAEGGRIVIPIGQTRRSQVMYRFTLRDGNLTSENLGRFAFVPLIGQGRSTAIRPPDDDELEP
ncbi:MAG: protein-L-isoaspartate(D-aspartate) O-methyltransferase [Planctomycetia bacterium]|nr:protein-L-isoaspartate(D-aspartate) O-methyltransferase [Planctomycetia bacterium]